jgi:hypothetical protein
MAYSIPSVASLPRSVKVDDWRNIFFDGKKIWRLSLKQKKLAKKLEKIGEKLTFGEKKWRLSLKQPAVLTLQKAEMFLFFSERKCALYFLCCPGWGCELGIF